MSHDALPNLLDSHNELMAYNVDIGICTMNAITNAKARELLTAASKAIYKATSRFGRTLTPSDISDISNTAFIKTIENFDESKGSIDALMYTVSYTVALDFLRGRNYAGGSKDAHLDDQTTEDDEGNSMSVDVEDHSPSALDLMLRAERDRDVAAAIATLNPCMIDALMVDGERALTGSERIAKMRAVDKLQETVKAR